MQLRWDEVVLTEWCLWARSNRPKVGSFLAKMLRVAYRKQSASLLQKLDFAYLFSFEKG